MRGFFLGAVGGAARVQRDEVLASGAKIRLIVRAADGVYYYETS